jgi:glycerate-2-kinase
LTELETARLHALKTMKECIREVDPRRMVRRTVRLKANKLFVGGRAFNLEPVDRTIVIGGGKASAFMASAVEEILGSKITAGRVIVPEYQSPLPRLKRIEFLKSTHPLPSRKGVAAVKEMLKAVEALDERDLVLCLISGGGSSLMPLPAKGVSVSDKRRVTELLLRSGASIQEVNCVRKHLSAIKGGRLAEMLNPATVISLIVSDVVGDDLASVASGLTVPDDSTFSEAEGILRKSGLWGKSPAAVRSVLERGAAGKIPETPKPGSVVFEKVHNSLVGSNLLARRAASASLGKLGYSVSEIADVQGEAREFGASLARLAMRKRAMTAIVAGGETVVSVRGKGKGGRNQEIALAASLEIADRKNVTVLSFSTDGVDGPTDAAGAIADETTTKRAVECGMLAERYLTDNDSYSFFKKLGDLVVTGPTGTNVNDVSLALVGPSTEHPRSAEFRRPSAGTVGPARTAQGD